MRFHFIGICGAGMSAVAKLLIEGSHTVTGSDEGFYPPISEYLLEHNIPCLSPYSSKNIPEDADYIVIGKHAKLTQEENEEVRAAFSSGKKILSFPQVLEMLIQDKESIVVAGSFGKSSCTSLLSWCLESSGKDISYFIGALPLTPKTNAHLGKEKEFVLEGDEYPSANWDSTSKFLYYNAHDLLLTALAHDHVNVFKTHEDYIAPFKKLISSLPSDGLSLVCIDDETIQKELPAFGRNSITYGLNETATYRATNILYGKTTTFDLYKEQELVCSLSTSLLGAHNVQNIVGVSAMILEKKMLSIEELQNAIASFKGIVRRLDRKSEKTSIPIYEGFGSSYDKARSAIEAIRLHFEHHPLTIIFEPHTFSWRNRQALHWYDDVFKGAQKVYIYKPPEHGKETHEQLTLEEIKARVSNSGIETFSFENPEQGLGELIPKIQKEDVVLILSSGGMDGLLGKLTNALEIAYPLN